MSGSAWIRVLALVAAAGSSGCSRADLYPITGEAGAGGSAGGDSSGGTGVSGSVSGGGGGSGAGGGSSGNGGGSGNGGSGGMPSACPPAVLPPGDSNQTVLVDGMARSYVLHVPEAYDGRTAVPLVVDFHGVGESGTSERMISPYPDVLDPEGVIMAFPDGLRGPAGTAWNVGPCCVADVDDVAFARALVDQVRGLACIDRQRVYAVGILTGGGMAHHVACHAADVFAAVAPAVFDLLEENVDDCKPSRPVTVISFRGREDGRVPYEGGPSSLVPGMPLTFLGAEGSFEAWSAINGCVGPASAPAPDGCSSYAGCAAGVEVILCTQEGGQEHGDPNIAWPVLSRHTL